jgi:hypothetical protein
VTAQTNSAEAMPEDVTSELNSDFEAPLPGATEIPALMSAWQSGAISRGTLLHNFRTGEILPTTEPRAIAQPPPKALAKTHLIFAINIKGGHKWVPP